MTVKIETFAEWMERLGIEELPEDREPAPEDWILKSSWAVSGPDEVCMAYRPRYRPIPGGAADAEQTEEAVRSIRIVFENAEDGGVAVYKENVHDGDREWLCGYGREDAEALFIYTTYSMLINHARIDGVSLTGGKRRRAIRFWAYARTRWNVVAKRLRDDYKEAHDAEA